MSKELCGHILGVDEDDLRDIGYTGEITQQMLENIGVEMMNKILDRLENVGTSFKDILQDVLDELGIEMEGR